MREISLTVRGDTVHASRHRAGIQGEANATALVVNFDESWDGYAKKITFWDALEQNPVVRGLNVACADRTYKTTIPGEPLALPGECLLVIDGYLDGGTRARSMSVRLTVEAAPVADNAGEPVDPTPDQYQELREDIEEIMADILMVKQGVEELLVIKEETVKVKDEAERARQAIEDMSAGGTFVPANSAEPWVEKQVDEDGAVNLHFNIRSGVFVGSGDMPEHCNVQVDPQGRVVTLDDLTGPQGEKGEKGDKGDTGDPGAQGPAGADGKTPVRGVDYYTPEDVEAIVAEAAARVEASEGTYELIEEITLEEAVMRIRCNYNPDRYSRMFVNATLAKSLVGGTANQINFAFMNEHGNVGSTAGIGSSTSGERWPWAECYQRSGRWICEWINGTTQWGQGIQAYSSKSSKMVCDDAANRTSLPYIVDINSTVTDVPIPAGSVFRIYGVVSKQ